jgi:uncharacterized protein with HEPN domain
MSEKDRRGALLRVHDIVESLKKIESFIKDCDYDLFLKEPIRQDAIVRNVQIIGEAAKRIPDDICAQYPLIPWRQVKAMRDVIVHNYYEIVPETVWRVAVEELPPLLPEFEKIYTDLMKEKK